MDLRYPIGPFAWNGEAGEEERRERIARIESTPVRLMAAVQGLSEEQLDTAYRPGGWTASGGPSHRRQPCKQLHAVSPGVDRGRAHDWCYDEERWANLPDAKTAPVLVSLVLVEALHRRWVQLLRSMGAEDFARTFVHPELGSVSLDRNLALYAWHGDHHIAHIAGLRDRMGWR